MHLFEVLQFPNELLDKNSREKVFEENNATVTEDNGMELKERRLTQLLANRTSLLELLITGTDTQPH